MSDNEEAAKGYSRAQVRAILEAYNQIHVLSVAWNMDLDAWVVNARLRDSVLKRYSRLETLHFKNEVLKGLETLLNQFVAK